jgi:thiol-disulfide isomerase/thioredoxin
MNAAGFALLGALALLSAACASPQPVTGRPPIPPGVPPEHLHFADATVARGQMAPDFTLPYSAGEGSLTLSSLRGKPVVLVFGSHTCNVFRRDIPALRKLYDETFANAKFVLVYVREAHPNDEWVMPDNEWRGLSCCR